MLYATFNSSNTTRHSCLSCFQSSWFECTKDSKFWTSQWRDFDCSAMLSRNIHKLDEPWSATCSDSPSPFSDRKPSYWVNDNAISPSSKRRFLFATGEFLWLFFGVLPRVSQTKVRGALVNIWNGPSESSSAIVFKVTETSFATACPVPQDLNIFLLFGVRTNGNSNPEQSESASHSSQESSIIQNFKRQQYFRAPGRTATHPSPDTCPISVLREEMWEFESSNVLSS